RRVAAGDLLELVRRVLLSVDAHATLGPAERDVHDGALVGHERGEGLDLVLIHGRSEADTALHGQAVVTVLGTPAGNDLVAALAPDRELERVNAVTGLDLIEQAAWILGQRRRSLEVDVDGVNEARRSTHRHGALLSPPCPPLCLRRRQERCEIVPTYDLFL